MVRQLVTVRQGVGREAAQKIIKAIKGSKLKTQASIQGDEVRVSGKKRDDLQATMTMIKALNLTFRCNLKISEIDRMSTSHRCEPYRQNHRMQRQTLPFAYYLV